LRKRIRNICLFVLRVDEGADFVAFEEAGEVARGVHVEDDDGHLAVGAKGVGRLVHYFEVLGDGFVEGEFIVLYGGGVFFGVGRVDAIDTGAFQEGVGADFKVVKKGLPVPPAMRATPPRSSTATASSRI